MIQGANGRGRCRKTRRQSRAASALRWLWCAFASLVALAFGADGLAMTEADEPVTIVYWDKWSGPERDAMQAVVDDFHASQDRIRVEFMSVSGIVQKTLIATAGGNPPDVAGVWANDVIDFADKNALIPIDEFSQGSNVQQERYLPVYWNMGIYRERLYGVPSTPGVTGLHWNKKAFREAGLDPERPPRTMAELDEYAEKLTLTRDGRIEQIGFLQTQPPWWPFFWVYFFDGQLWDGGENITLDAPNNVEAFHWIQDSAERYGVGALQTLSESFGTFASAQNPFMSGKLSMVFQGVWLANYIDQYSPGLEWGAAPMPVQRLGDPPVTFVDSDMLIIPRGAKHPEAAFEFIDFVSRQQATEKLNLGQRKNSPLRDVSDHFFDTHKHPYIRMFQELAESPKAIGQPKMGIWREYRNEIETVFQRVWLLEATPDVALSQAKVRMQTSWDRAREREQAEPSEALSILPVGLLVVLVLLAGAFIALRRQQQVRLLGGRSARANASLGRGLVFFSPWSVGLVVFLGYPVMSSLVYSFCDYSVLTTTRFIGLANFADLVHDEVFWIALGNTLYYVAFALPLGLLVAFGTAVMLDARVHGVGIYRTLVFLPSMMPVVSSALLWLWIFNAEYGVLNHLLATVSFGAIDEVPWLVDPSLAMPSLILMSVWSMGQTVVILLAAMQDVPTSVYEAADLDGANFLQKIWHITVPLTSPVIFFNAIMGIIVGLQLFAQPYIMTAGGPARATLTYTMRLYDSAFVFLRMGYASAMAWILFLVILVLTGLALRAGNKRVHYTGV